MFGVGEQGETWRERHQVVRERRSYLITSTLSTRGRLVSVGLDHRGQKGRKKARRVRDRGEHHPPPQRVERERNIADSQNGKRTPVGKMASAGKMGLMAMAVLVPCAVLFGVAKSGGGTNGMTSKAVDGASGAGRRLQTATYAFATQLEMTICLTEDHGTDSATASGEQVCVFLSLCGMRAVFYVLSSYPRFFGLYTLHRMPNSESNASGVLVPRVPAYRPRNDRLGDPCKGYLSSFVSIVFDSLYVM